MKQRRSYDTEEKNSSLVEKLDRAIEKAGVRIKDADQIKVLENVFDDQTLLALYKLVNKGKISAIGGSISTGKEANVFFAEDGEGNPAALKIYRIQSANFNNMSMYMTGDPRFSSVRKSRKEFIFTWTKKEYSNLMRAHDAGVPCPLALFFDRNILLMEFCGENGTAYPTLRDTAAHFSEEEAAAVYRAILADMKLMFQKANLVHADLSEFNILCRPDGNSYKHIIIDMGQAVLPEHPKAVDFLVRDIKNINRFFSKLCPVDEEKEIFTEIIGKEKMEF